MSKQAVIVFFKYPELGKVKTRLCKKFSVEAVTQLYEMFIYDTIEKLLALRNSDIFAFAAYESEQKNCVQDFFSKKSIPIFLQLGEGLGERMSNAFGALFEKNYQNIVILGTDSPDLPLDYVENAFSFLELHRPGVCLAPSEDGGYYLLGMNKFFPTLFQQVTYSSTQTFYETLKQALKLPASLATLSAWYDVDEPEDLVRLAKNLHSPLLSHTKDMLKTWIV